ncbi:MAG: MaoC family dehydratase N-terminal domain-containing protein [Gammaproteobacteria bacterium]|nr:MaoC family dehydratase N-terminal domain-containing protein [Gammaproteobacteria bacterium]
MPELITEELRSQIGLSPEPRTELVTRRDIRKYAVATGQRLRKYLDGDEAPPLFHLALFWDVVEQDKLSPDGVALDNWLPEFPLKRAMAGKLQLEYHQPILPGQTLTARRTLCDMYEKQGSSGPLIFYEVSTDVSDATGAAVLTERATRILR